MRSPHVVYLSVFVSMAAAFFVVLGGFNLVVDPYAIFNTPVTQGFNDAKNGRGHVTEPYRMIVDRYTDLVVGSSRVQGFTCQDMLDVMQDDAAACKVAPVPHANASWLIKNVYHALALRPVKRVYFGLDFFGFNMAVTPFQASDEERLIGVPGKSDVALLNDLFRQLFSPAVTKLSLETMRTSARNDTERRGVALASDDSSRRLPTVPETGVSRPSAAPAVPETGASRPSAAPAVPASATGGSGSGAPSTSDSLFIKFYPGIVGYYSDYTYAIPGKNRTVLDELRSLLLYCRERKVEVYLFINPFHSIMLDIFREHGLLERYLSWKVSLSTIVDEANSGLSEPLFHLWDFSGYNAVTTEQVVVDGEVRSGLNYYTDAFHYTHAVGRKILEAMLSKDTADRDFGVLLSGLDVSKSEEMLEMQRRAHQGCNTEYFDALLRRAAAQATGAR